ncbi:amino acid ABC transporter substrate-binding protein [Waterburya agarophytonicola K14]|uniref:Amino acid ABC transporter substrate-binding protein n=1 Tax=Waterburya agarophytonicola KI4 TaxID=2874699 RepID=A0A964FH28_9CYAN|nr:ABC transporter substrate-binding protein [Waterburya agarophytonicola]MCC0178721.1 amino acid ABC transporter substrate-binding protein [Waterburya agarophytonicola KI4]
MADFIPKKRIPPNNSEEFMTKEQNHLKSRKIFIFTILVAILFGIWSIDRTKKSSNTGVNLRNSFLANWKSQGKETKFQYNLEIKQRSSLGEKILIGADNNPDKQLAMKNFAAGNFPEAQIKFSNSLEINPNDPETLIYLNNSLAAREKQPITIGVSVPIGGSLDVAKEILRGVAQAQNEINKQGGVEQNGIKTLVRVQIANDDNDPEIAQKIATSFVANPDIIGVVGHNSSSSSLAAAPIYQKGNLVMISPTSVARELSQAGSYIFRTTPSSRILAETLAEYAANNIRRQKVAICVDSSSPASVSFKDEFSLSLFESGGEVTAVNCDFASEVFNPDRIPSEAIANGAEALLLIPSVNKINQALEVARANQNRLVVLGNHSMYTYETLDIGQSDIKGIVLPTAWHPKATKDSEFNHNAIALWGMEGNWRTATAYDATKAILNGLNSVTTRQGLQQALINPGFSVDGALGKVTFKPSGDRQIQATLVKVEPGKASGTGYDFMPLDSLSLTEAAKK